MSCGSRMIGRLIAVAAWAVCLAAGAEDWNQWRGSGRNGIAAASPALLNAWSPKGLKKLWESEPVPGGRIGGYGCVSIAGGFAYVLLHDPGAVKNPKAPLTAGVVYKDVILCLRATDGTTVWKKEYPGQFTGDEETCASSTPTVVDGRVYVAGSKALYCLNAKDGTEAWVSSVPEWSSTNSSPLVVDGMAVLQAGPKLGEAAFDVSDGKKLWNEKKVAASRGTNPSTVAWKKDGKTCLVSNTDKETFCLEAKTGKILWTIAGGGYGTAAVCGDILVIGGGNCAYRMSADKAEELWKQTGGFGCSAVVADGRVYVARSQNLFCIGLTDGKILWKQKGNFCGRFFEEYTSPILADGKLFTVSDGGQALCMIKASPDKFEQLGRVEKAGLALATSPVVADGRMYLRGEKAIVCYDLTKAPE
ncbi:MAG: PQQ-like beta-propeller repeat protein [Planctomycetota bacterium]|nr:PQQ-like beta-propeller repeat protein [Planctomycetota bacterium]